MLLSINRVSDGRLFQTGVASAFAGIEHQRRAELVSASKNNRPISCSGMSILPLDKALNMVGVGPHGPRLIRCFLESA